MRSAWVLVVLACGLWLPGQRSAVQAAAIIEDHSSSWGVGTPGVCARSTRGSKQAACPRADAGRAVLLRVCSRRD